MESCKLLNWLKRVAREALVSGPCRMSQILAKMNLAALKHSEGVGPKRLDQFDLHVWVPFRVTVQEIGNHTFYKLRGGCHFEHAGVSPPEQLRALVKCTGVAQ